MRVVLVPNELREEIYRRVDEALKEHPAAVTDREHFYNALLAHFDEHGEIPEFSIQPKEIA